MRLGNNLFDVNRTCRLLRHHDGPFGFIWLHPVGIRGICDASKLKNISHKDHEDRHDQIKWLEAFEAEKKPTSLPYFAPLTPYWPPGGGINGRQCMSMSLLYWRKKICNDLFPFAYSRN